MFIQKATRGLYQRISASPLARIPLYTAATRNIGGTPHGLSDEEIANRNEMIPIVRLFLLLLLLVCCCSTTTTLLLLLYSSRISMFPRYTWLQSTYFLHYLLYLLSRQRPNTFLLSFFLLLSSFFFFSLNVCCALTLMFGVRLLKL